MVGFDPPWCRYIDDVVDEWWQEGGDSRAAVAPLWVIERASRTD
jgi:hypothetical protein